MTKTIIVFVLSIFTLCICGCDTYYIEGPPGPQGEKGETGPQGEKGDPGEDGQDFPSCLHEGFVCPDGYECSPQGGCLLSPTDSEEEDLPCGAYHGPDEGSHLTARVRVDVWEARVHNNLFTEEGASNAISVTGEIGDEGECTFGAVVISSQIFVSNFQEMDWIDMPRFSISAVGWAVPQPTGCFGYMLRGVTDRFNLTCIEREMTWEIRDEGLEFYVVVNNTPTIFPGDHPVAWLKVWWIDRWSGYVSSTTQPLDLIWDE